VAFYTVQARAEFAAEHENKANEAMRSGCDCVPITNEDGALVGWVDADGEDVTRRIGRSVLCMHQSTVKWHRVRGVGQRVRFVRVADCKERAISMHCGSCKHLVKRDVSRCGQHRVCVHCRGRRAQRMRASFSRARKAALDRYKHYLNGNAPGTAKRRWGERFLTLTYPDSGDPAADVRALYDAWPKFIRRVRRFLEKRLHIDPEFARALPFLRVVEVTPTERVGHAHLHVWMIGPFIHHALIRAWWARSLSREARARLPRRQLADVLAMGRAQAELLEVCGTLDRDRKAILLAARERADGRAGDELEWPVVDIRACHGDPGKELIKYLVKDIQAGGELIDPYQFSKIYLALERRRLSVSSRYFWLPYEPQTCPCCGAVGSTRVTLEPDTRGERAQGPPRWDENPQLSLFTAEPIEA